MPGLGRHPCGACHYVASNRRMLARHAVLIHSEKVFKCPVCPFITRYAANWYRHKRDLHGLTKVTSCEVCGFFANSTAELAAHKEIEHPEHLQIEKYEDKYAREKLRLSGNGLQGKAPRSSNCLQVKAPRSSNSLQGKVPRSNNNLQGKVPRSSNSLQVKTLKSSGNSLKSSYGQQEKALLPSSSSSLASSNSLQGKTSIFSGNFSENATAKDKLKVTENIVLVKEEKTNVENTDYDESYGEDSSAFFEPITVIEEFGEEQANVLKDLNFLVADDDEEGESLDESVTFSLPLNGHLLSNGDEFSDNGVVEKKLKDTSLTEDCSGSSPDNLGPLKVKRSYNCIECGLLTSNPREYLYHLRNNHGEKISVFECKYCIYASKHVQKLHRHCSLVHRLLIDKDPEYQKQLEASKEKRAKPVMNKLAAPLLASTPLGNGVHNSSSPNTTTKPATRSRNQNMLKCSVCPYQTRNKAFLQHHEKTVHLKKRFYRCLQCGYTTSERGRYTKHIRYHSLPKMQCEFCFFKTAYKWNMERHMKNHESGAEGAFHCTSCNFTTSTKQSFKSHVTNHHNNSPEEDFVEEEESNPNESENWEDIEEEMQNEEEEESFIMPDENVSMESYEFPEENKDKSDMVWKDGKAYPKVLQCKLCDFKAAWPFELKKHEENHRSQKKHECPLCGMRFEHIAWLTKHLRRVHQENSQAKNIAAAFELLKPTRRRPGKEYASDTVLPIFQEVLKQNKAATNKAPEAPKNSMLSTLLNKPLQPFMPTSLNKFSSRFKSKAFASATNMSRQLTMGNYYEKAPSNEPAAISNSSLKSKNVPTCNVCGYKTRWISELQRHMRVHSQEKPFHCPKCKYHCKWKGDLNRHLMKYHGIKVPSSNKKPVGIVPKLKLKKSVNDDQDLPNDWHRVNPEVKRSLFPPRNSGEDGPLDLTTKDTFPNPCSSDMYNDPYDFEKFSSTRMDSSPNSSNPKPPLQHLREASYPSQDSPAPVVSTKRKYQCPFCTFATTTASRFHVHIVQHYNRRPFCCSVCEYNSNWEWDITKHIRLKNCKDKFQNKACVLLTDESGRRNYEKYEKYLVDINAPPPNTVTRPPGVSIVPEVNSSHNVNRPLGESPTKSCSYDFRNIGSNFEDTPENIVVTPDINIPETPDGIDSSYTVYNNPHNVAENFNESKSFYCKHCNFKHATKRVVISHLSVHAGIKPFRCRACGITSNWRHVIVRHVKDAHNGYMNEVEDRITFSQEGFALSLTSINSNSQNNVCSDVPKAYAPQFGCKICPYKCDKEFYIKFHMKQHRPREGAVYRCDFCPYFVKFKKTLIRHTKLHMPSSSENITMDDTLDFEDIEESDQMQLDNSPIPELYEMYQNDSTDDSIAISFDQLNQFSFSDPVSPPKIKRHICEQCPYKTDNKTQYLYHKQFHRPNSSAPFKCTVCSYWATMQHLLTQHMKVHSGSDAQTTPKEGEENFPEKVSIPTTNLSPSDSDWMDKMSVIYVKRDNEIVKMFKCNFCPMMNKKKANVRVHQKMHGVIVKNGKFACSYCDYQCLNQGGLTNHLKIHQKVPEKEVQQSLDDSEAPQRDSNLDDASSSRKKFFSYFCMKCPALFKSSNDLEIHSKFHGSAMQFGCTMCDYRTRQKTHLVKHLSVHSPEYMAKREAAQGPSLNPDGTSSNDPTMANIEIPLVKKIDQMLLLEASEMSFALKKTGEAAALLKKCVFCPAPFFKTSTLAYHISLHGSEGEFKCCQCDYATSRSANLTAHYQIHPKKKNQAKPRKPPLRTFPCSKCPAVFYKQDRFDRHLELHGKNYKYGCKDCDYSVRFAANLIKHRNLHAAKLDAENTSTPTKALEQVTPIAKPMAENLNFHEPEEKKVMFICDRCPYAQSRKDAVQSHQRRHWLRDGFKCPYCDYTSMQSGFVHSHIKMHIQPSGLFPPQAFMKYESLKIFVKEEDEEEKLLFDDQEMVKHKNDNTSKHKRKRKSEEGSSKKKKFSSYDKDFTNLPNNSKVPVVVLSDVLANKELMKWAPKLKIPKLKLTKCVDSISSEKKYSKLNISYDSESKLQTKPKPSLVVKISKVENSNNEKTMYSVCTKTSDPPPPIISTNDLNDTSLDGDCSEDIHKDNVLDGSVCDNSTLEKNEVHKSIPTKEGGDLKSDENVSSDVPETVDVSLCESLDKDAGIANGETAIPLTNGLPMGDL